MTRASTAARRAFRAYAAHESWHVYCLRYALTEMYLALPGPWWCKLALFLLCQLIPGGFDELALILIAKAWRRWVGPRVTAWWAERKVTA